MIKIKPIGKEFINSIYLLGKTEFGGDFWFTKKFVEETMNSPGFYFGAFHGKKLIGSILAKKFDRPKLWIFLFLVSEKWRRKGIGKKLLGAVERKCSKNFPLIFVDFNRGDKIARRFYLKNGFVKKGEIEDWFGIDETGLVYAKRLV